MWPRGAEAGWTWVQGRTEGPVLEQKRPGEAALSGQPPEPSCLLPPKAPSPSAILQTLVGGLAFQTLPVGAPDSGWGCECAWFCGRLLAREPETALTALGERTTPSGRGHTGPCLCVLVCTSTWTCVICLCWGMLIQELLCRKCVSVGARQGHERGGVGSVPSVGTGVSLVCPSP